MNLVTIYNNYVVFPCHKILSWTYKQSMPTSTPVYTMGTIEPRSFAIVDTIHRKLVLRMYGLTNSEMSSILYRHNFSKPIKNIYLIAHDGKLRLKKGYIEEVRMVEDYLGFQERNDLIEILIRCVECEAQSTKHPETFTMSGQSNLRYKEETVKKNREMVYMNLVDRYLELVEKKKQEKASKIERRIKSASATAVLPDGSFMTLEPIEANVEVQVSPTGNSMIWSLGAMPRSVTIENIHIDSGFLTEIQDILACDAGPGVRDRDDR